MQGKQRVEDSGQCARTLSGMHCRRDGVERSMSLMTGRVEHTQQRRVDEDWGQGSDGEWDSGCACEVGRARERERVWKVCVEGVGQGRALVFSFFSAFFFCLPRSVSLSLSLPLIGGLFSSFSSSRCSSLDSGVSVTVEGMEEMSGVSFSRTRVVGKDWPLAVSGGVVWIHESVLVDEEDSAGAAACALIETGLSVDCGLTITWSVSWQRWL
jgi:hypothetical protein